MRYGPDSDLMTYEQPQQEDTQELRELRKLVKKYDRLFEKCMTRPMTNEENRTLNGLYEALSHIEASYWEQTPESIIASIQNEVDTDFPAILFMLGLLPTEDN